MENNDNTDPSISDDQKNSPQPNEEISKSDILEDATNGTKIPEAIKHSEFFNKLLQQVPIVNFKDFLGIKDQNKKPSSQQIIVAVIEVIKNTASANGWDLCKNQGQVYAYNSKYWELMDEETVHEFLGKAAEKMGIDKYYSRHYRTRDQLFLQFMATGYLERPVIENGMVLINLPNGTFEIMLDRQILRPANSKDFLTHLLPFSYDPSAKAPLFLDYLNKVLPNQAVQDVLSEFTGYLFVDNSVLKLEKVLMLHGDGANGKSVYHDIITAVLGKDNISGFSIQNLSNENGYYRAMLANKLANYSSELGGKLDFSTFKELSSGDPVPARLPYGDPITLRKYARLIFNCNILPKEAELTHAYFRRFLIIPFEVTIPEAEQDKSLAKKIIDNELAGIFNWVLKGLNRLLKQKNFTQSDIINKQTEIYRKNSDNVNLFLEEEEFVKSTTEHMPLKELYSQYRTFTFSSGYHACSSNTFSERLRALGFVMVRKNKGMVVYTVCNQQFSIWDE